jgi:hypothetical protein
MSRSTQATCHAEWRGTVESISPAAAQEFSLLPAQNTSGNWVKVVQRIPMRVHLDTKDKNLPPLRAGMSVVVKAMVLDPGYGAEQAVLFQLRNSAARRPVVQTAECIGEIWQILYNVSIAHRRSFPS